VPLVRQPVLSRPSRRGTPSLASSLRAASSRLLPDALPAYRRPLPFLYESTTSRPALRRRSPISSIPSRAAARSSLPTARDAAALARRRGLLARQQSPTRRDQARRVARHPSGAPLSVKRLGRAVSPDSRTKNQVTVQFNRRQETAIVITWKHGSSFAPEVRRRPPE